MASLVPDPMEKCAVCAASPNSTMLSLYQRSHSTRLNLIHTAEPRRCLALEISGWPSSKSANSRSQNAMDAGISNLSRPAFNQVLSGVSTMNVDISSLKRYA